MAEMNDFSEFDYADVFSEDDLLALTTFEKQPTDESNCDFDSPQMEDFFNYLEVDSDGNLLDGPVSLEGKSVHKCTDDGDSDSKPNKTIPQQPTVIVRPPFPRPVRDRSPIIGLSSETFLRTCFRIGEALNAGCGGTREGKDVVVELYARVASSSREAQSVKQHFVFYDLFHDRPPFMNGVYELWKGVELWNSDSSRFLNSTQEKKMCRCIGKMKREGRAWQMTILSIWEASWDDVSYAQGVICVE
ncbi:hypothetical protein GQ43DRAFT_441699 [Delitschia confertaspora ATCC 74209]|uniref:Uncharacterized protein n=1 Tax=Delitschia confertaspora ATCC 74209 TaxID=1513339 RepID=A0A9P4JIY2_9PLEO|nr:hypothetical protein GQ43DRAFT_441699 [Delitschia confertaspora ATCC 74209]